MISIIVRAVQGHSTVLIHPYPSIAFIRWVALLVILLVTACSGGNGGPAGTWEIDKAATTAALDSELKESGNPMAEQIARAMTAMVEEMDWTVTLDEAGAAALNLAEGGRDFDTIGSWTLDGNTLKLDYYDQRDRSVMISGSLDGGLITFDSPDPDGPSILMKRSSRAALEIEEPPPVPPLGPLRAACPASPSTDPRAGPPDDIVGLRPGMSYDDVVAVLECRNDIRVIKVAPMFNIQENYGIPTRQLVRGSNGIPCSEREARGERCSTLGRFEPLRDASEEYIVAFTGMPGEEIARAVWRRSVYTGDDQAISVLTEALNSKYGVPQLQATGNHSRINTVRGRATNLVWLYDKDGSALPPPTSQFSNAALNWETCINGPSPAFAGRHGWSSGCHLTIRAEILPKDANGLLAGELNMVVMNQRDFYYGGQQFENALRIVSDEKLRQGSSQPEL